MVSLFHRVRDNIKISILLLIVDTRLSFDPIAYANTYVRLRNIIYVSKTEKHLLKWFKLICSKKAHIILEKNDSRHAINQDFRSSFH